MKKFLFILCAVCVFIMSSCSSNEANDLPQIYVDQPRYSLAKGMVEIKIHADKAPSTDISVPIIFAGAAIEGTDFVASAPSFTFEAGKTEAILTLTRIEENIGNTNKELILNLGKAPEGYSLGVMNYSLVELLGSQGVIVSFDKSEDKLMLSSTYNISLKNMKGTNYKVASETKFDINIDPSSTAVEGTHFEFETGSYITVAKNKWTGSIGIRFLKKEAGKDKLVLRLANRDGYAFGTNASIGITINGADVFTGTWAFDKIANLGLFQDYGEDISKAPQGTSSDQITFTGDSYLEYTFTPNMTGSFVNYFGTSSRKVTFKKEADKVFQEESGAKVRMAVLEIPSVNVKFSSTHKDIRPALVGFRLIHVDGKETLECTIDDFEPIDPDFGAIIYSFFYSMEDAPLRVHFTKVR